MAGNRFQGRGRARLIALAFLLLVSTSGTTPAATADSACSGARSAVSEDASSADVARVRGALTCLIGRERGSRDLAALESDSDLRQAAVAHSRDMVRRHYFDHTSPGGSTAERRVRKAGYLESARRWSVGEALAWGIREEASAQRLFESLMDSPVHRALLLDASFRDIGVGVALGAPTRGDEEGPGVTVTIALGRVSRR